MIAVNARGHRFARPFFSMAMSNAKNMAGLVGPVLMAVTASEAMNLRIWSEPVASVTYLDGSLLFIAGVAIVRAHNLWTRRWPVLITLTGWLALGLGLLRMFFPTVSTAGTPATFVVIALLFAAGCVLTVQSFVAK